MEKSQIKIIVSASTGAYVTDINTDEIENLENTRFSCNLGGGQGEVDFELKTNYDNSSYAEKQLVEIAFYNDDFKSGFLQYSGFIKNINRTYSQEKGDSVDIEILGIGSLLGEYSGAFTFSGTLTAAIDAFITQFQGVYDIASPMEFLGSTLFKNGITDTSAVSLNLTGTYFDILRGIFDSLTMTWFIDKAGNIYLGNQSTNEHLLGINKDIIDLRLSSSRETEITLTGNNYDIAPGDKIFIQNINSSFNLDGSRIEKVELGLLETRIYLGNIWALGSSIASGGVGGSSGGGETATTIGALINASDAKTTLVDADMFSIRDSVTGLLQKFSWLNMKARLEAYFDTIYEPSIGYTPEDAANKNVANGYAGLDSSGLVDPSHLPASSGISLLEVQIFT